MKTDLLPLKDLPFVRGLDADQLRLVAELASPARWAAGETVFREGDDNPMLYLVESGRVAIEVTIPGRGRVSILTVGPGEVFGWSSLFHRRPKTAAARAIEPTHAVALDAGRLGSLCDADPGLGYLLTRRILEVVSERLKATRMQLMDIYVNRPLSRPRPAGRRRTEAFGDADNRGGLPPRARRSSSTSPHCERSSIGSGARATRSWGRPSATGRSCSTS